MLAGNTRDMPPKESPLLCELHAHTTWSDGDLTVRELCDLYGRRGFDVLAVTDHAPREPRQVQARTTARTSPTCGPRLYVPVSSTTCSSFPVSSSPTTTRIPWRRLTLWRSACARTSTSRPVSSLRSPPRERKGRRSSPPTRIRPSPSRPQRARRRVRRAPRAASPRRPVRAVQPPHAVRLGRRRRAAGDRERRLPPRRAPRGLEDAASVPEDRAGGDLLPAFRASRVPRPARRRGRAARGLSERSCAYDGVGPRPGARRR